MKSIEDSFTKQAWSSKSLGKTPDIKVSGTVEVIASDNETGGRVADKIEDAIQEIVDDETSSENL